MAEPPRKKGKYDSLFEKFPSFEDKELFLRLYETLCSHRSVALLPRKITYCDADAKDGKPFSKATCHVQVPGGIVEELYPFGSIFDKGIRILNDLTLKDGFKPEDDETRALLTPLLEFLFDKDSHEALRRGSLNGENETKVTMTLAAHFFSKLAVSQGYILDKFTTKKTSTCKCKDCKKKDFSDLFGDTSIGHKDVWHGNLDIILDSSEIGVSVTPKDEISPGGRTSVEVKFSELGSVPVRDQALSQTITFSFLQQQLHPNMKHFLIPTILASNKKVQFFFYDSKNDILLESRHFDFFLKGEKMQLNYQTVIATWLVLNYKYLCSGPTEYILEAPKADFPSFAGTSLKIYKSLLKFQKVDETVFGRIEPLDTWNLIDIGTYNDCRFRWPQSLSSRPPKRDTDKPASPK